MEDWIRQVGGREMWKNLIDRSLLERGTTVAVAVSGGRDSITLLALLHEHRQELDIRVCCVHVCHHIRENAEQDALAVQSFCRDRDIPFRRYDVDVLEAGKEISHCVEAAARTLRYRAFEECMKSGFADCVAVAHTADDVAETVLFNLIRGSGTGGASAMKPVLRLPSGNVIRPFYRASRAGVAALSRALELPICEDETNADLCYSRNRLRAQVLPALEQAHPGAVRNLLAFSERMGEIDAFLRRCAEGYLRNGCLSTRVPKACLPYALRIALADLGVRQNVTGKHVAAVANLLDLNAPLGKFVNLPDGVVARVDRVNGPAGAPERCIRLERPAPGNPPAFRENYRRAASRGEVEGTGFRITISENIVPGGLYGGADCIPESAVFRFPEPGDLFRKFGGGTKKLCDWFTDRKIPRDIRPRTPVLADGKRILAVFPYAVSEDLRLQPGAKPVCFLTSFL